MKTMAFTEGKKRKSSINFITINGFSFSMKNVDFKKKVVSPLS